MSDCSQTKRAASWPGGQESATRKEGLRVSERYKLRPAKFPAGPMQYPGRDAIGLEDHSILRNSYKQSMMNTFWGSFVTSPAVFPVSTLKACRCLSPSRDKPLACHADTTFPT